jgi:PKD domain-containing protein
VHARTVAVATTREKLVLSAVLALAFACRLDKLLETPRPPGLGVAPSQVVESADSGSGDVDTLALMVSSNPSRVLTWTAHREADSTWLVLTDASGSTPDTLRFTLAPGDRPPGTYRNAIILVPDSSTTPSVRVPVELRIARVAPNTGALTVIVHTTGNTPDPNGYTVTVDGAQTRLVAIEDTITYTGVAAGSRSVQLSGLAPNCTVPAGATRPVVVAAGQTATVTFAVSCPTTPPPTGTLKVKASTTGATPDPNGYTVTIDGDSSRTIMNNDSTTYTLVAGTSYLVELGDVASNCTVTGGPSQTKTVTAGQTVTAPFTVTCPTPPPPTGDLTVTTSTTGSSLDPNGYTVAVDGGTPRSIAINNSTGITFTGLAPGDHSVVLSDLASNCTVTNGAASRTVSVTAGQATTVPFTVSCSTTPPPTGDLRVTTNTTGSSLDPDGYSVAVDGGTPRSIAINNSTGITFTGLTAGDHSVVLSGVAANCTVTGGPSQTVAVPSGGTGTAAYTITCSTPTGTLTVATNTTGSSLDPDGYTVTVDGGSAQSIGINASVDYPGLAAGNHTVAISGVASTCTVSGATSRTVSVPSGGTATTTFTITCTTPPPPTGDLTVTVSTTGGTPDPDGYTVTVDGAQTRGLGINESTTYAGIAAGSHSVQLNGLASNCTVSGSNPRSVNVPDGGTGSTTFTVSCPDPPPPPNQTPSVNAGTDDNALLAVLYTLGASFSDPDNGPWSFTIDWGDGSSSSGNASSPGAINRTHTYVLPGSYRIRVTVSDSLGATGSDEMILTVAL